MKKRIFLIIILLLIIPVLFLISAIVVYKKAVNFGKDEQTKTEQEVNDILEEDGLKLKDKDVDNIENLLSSSRDKFKNTRNLYLKLIGVGENAGKSAEIFFTGDKWYEHSYGNDEKFASEAKGDNRYVYVKRGDTWYRFPEELKEDLSESRDTYLLLLELGNNGVATIEGEYEKDGKKYVIIANDDQTKTVISKDDNRLEYVYFYDYNQKPIFKMEVEYEKDFKDVTMPREYEEMSMQEATEYLNSLLE